MFERASEVLRQQIEAMMREYPELADDEILRADMLEGSTDIKEVVTGIHRMIEDAKALRDGTQERLDELTSRKARFSRRVEFGRDLILRIMDAAQIKKLELPECTASVRQGQQQLLGDPDPMALPDELVKVTRTPDKTKIKDALSRGLVVPGYTLSNAAPSLQLKVK